MRNKLTIKEGEIQRILGLHKKAILKENKSIVAEAENTFKVVSPLQLEPTKGWGNANGIKIWNAVFKPSTKIKNSLITTKKVIVQTVAEGSIFWEKVVLNRDNKAYVVYNCKTQKAYVLGSTDPNAKKYIDYKSKIGKWTFNASNMQSLQKLCNKIPKDPTLRDEVVVKYEKGNEGSSEYDKENKNLTSYNKGVRGNRYSFDYNAIMKAIDDTGKCGSVSGSSDGTNSTSVTQGTSGVSGIQAPAPISNKISKELYYKIIAP